MPLPPGQRAREEFPRFGLPQFARRFPQQTHDINLDVSVGPQHFTITGEDLSVLPRVTQVSDFHCVTTWSCLGLEWSGYLFRRFFDQFVGVDASQGIAVLYAQDGFSARLPLADLLAGDVLLADQLNGVPLNVAHGAPLRLIAPAHYGYKSVKHLSRIEIRNEPFLYRGPAPRIMEHPRARVAFEERGSVIPGRILRVLYRPLVRLTEQRFQRALTQRPNL